MMMKPTLEIYDANDIQYRPAFRGLKFSKVWQGGEDLILGFLVDRSSALDWPDVGYGYEVVLRHGLAGLWSGWIRHIEQDVETIAITALGNWIYLDDYPYIGGGTNAGTLGRLWCDTRYGRWMQATDADNANFAPERYQIDQNDRLFLAPRNDELFSTAYRGVLKYTCMYDDVKRITFDYNFVDPDDWVAYCYSMEDDRSNINQEWSLAATAAGAADFSLTNPRPRIEFQLVFTGAKAAYTGETGEDCYLKIKNLYIYGTGDTTPCLKNVGDDMVDQLQAGTPIENDKTLIENIQLTLKPLFYEEGETCHEALKDCADFGDANNKNVGWGVESGGARIFVKAPDRDSVRYIVPPEHASKLSVRGQADKYYASSATGQYIDTEGEIRFTDTYYSHVTTTGIVANTTSTGDDLASTVYNVTKERIIPFGRIGSGLATDYIKRYVIEHGRPYVQSSFEVQGRVQDLDKGGAWIEPYEMETGYLVQIPHFRAVEAEGASGSDLREWDTTFLLVGLEYDDERSTVRLIPEGATEDLDIIIQFVRRFREETSKRELKRYVRAMGL